MSETLILVETIPGWVQLTRIFGWAVVRSMDRERVCSMFAGFARSYWTEATVSH